MWFASAAPRVWVLPILPGMSLQFDVPSESQRTHWKL